MSGLNESLKSKITDLGGAEALDLVVLEEAEALGRAINGDGLQAQIEFLRNQRSWPDEDILAAAKSY